MKLIIAGSRKFVPEEEHVDWLDSILDNNDIIEVVSGAQSGADEFGEEWAEAHGIKVTRFPADWTKFGKAAGPIRNGQMAKYADAAALLPGNEGTMNMRKQALANGLVVFEYTATK